MSDEQKHLIAAATALRELVESGELGKSEIRPIGGVDVCTFAVFVRATCRAIAEHDDWPIEDRWRQLRHLQRLARAYRLGGNEALKAAMVR